MSKREVKLYLTDIDDAISAIRLYTEGMTYEQLLGDRKTREAIILNFVVIGEAIKKIPPEIILNHFLMSPGKNLRDCGTRWFTGISR